MKELMQPAFLGPLAIGIFLAIVFLQSALDKIFDWKGNLSWLTSHFSKSFLAGSVTPMLAIVTLLELVTGLTAICGIVCVFWCKETTCILYAIILAMITLLMLLFGQRVAKDYEGAKTIAIYFGIALIGLLFF